jgi:hypothetical protein
MEFSAYPELSAAKKEIALLGLRRNDDAVSIVRCNFPRRIGSGVCFLSARERAGTNCGNRFCGQPTVGRTNL